MDAQGIRPRPLSHLAPQFLHPLAREGLDDWHREKRRAPVAFRKRPQVTAKDSPSPPSGLAAPHTHRNQPWPLPLVLEIFTTVPTPWLRNRRQDSTLSLQLFQTNFSEIFI